MNSEGEWIDKKEGTDFTVDREKGIVTFSKAPGEPPVNGQDNVKITAAKDRGGYVERSTAAPCSPCSA